MPHIKLGSVRIFYDEFGNENSKETIILLHGWNENRRIFKFQIEDLSRKYKIYILDLRGHGKSSKPRFGYFYTRMARDIDKFIKKLDIKNPIIVGHSMGGQIALQYYLKYNNCKKLILISSPYKMPTELSGIIQLGTDYMLKKLRNRLKYTRERMIANLKDNDTLDNETENFFKNINFQVPLYVTFGLVFNTLTFNIRKKLNNIKIPVLILAGEKDDLAPIYLFEKMQEEIPDCRLVKFENCGHFSFIEEPKRSNEIMMEFIDNKN